MKPRRMRWRSTAGKSGIQNPELRIQNSEVRSQNEDENILFVIAGVPEHLPMTSGTLVPTRRIYSDRNRTSGTLVPTRRICSCRNRTSGTLVPTRGIYSCRNRTSTEACPHPWDLFMSESDKHGGLSPPGFCFFSPYSLLPTGYWPNKSASPE